MKNTTVNLVKLATWLLSATLACGITPSAFGFYNPNVGRWTTRDPIEEDDSPNLYQFVKNNPLLFIDLLGLRRWIMFYYSRLDQGEFKRAAETAKRDVEKRPDFNPKCDAVLMKGALSAADFQTAWASAKNETTGSDPNLKVQEVHLFTHSGVGMLHLLNSSLSASQITELPQLNWTDTGRVVAHGCNSGVWDGKGDSVAGSFANGQGVRAEGQTGFSQFSESAFRRTIFSRVGPDSKTVYLWSYGDGGRKRTFGLARPPQVFHPQRNGK